MINLVSPHSNLPYGSQTAIRYGVYFPTLNAYYVGINEKILEKGYCSVVYNDENSL